MVTFTQKRITPKEATRILATNTNNRRVRDSVVRRFAADMANGVWNVNGETIKLTSKGELVDGQHRLMACVLANTPFTTAVANGVPRESQETIDTGAPRKLTDVLTWKGYSDVTAVSAAVKTAWRWDNDVVLDRSMIPSNNQCLRYLDEHPGLIDAIKVAGKVSGGPLHLRTSVYAPLIDRLTEAGASEELEDFHEKLVTGLNLTERSPVYALRRWLVRMHEIPGTVPLEVYLAVLIKAWNFNLLGQDIGQLRFRRSGTAPEEFPKLLLPSDLEV